MSFRTMELVDSGNACLERWNHSKGSEIDLENRLYDGLTDVGYSYSATSLAVWILGPLSWSHDIKSFHELKQLTPISKWLVEIEIGSYSRSFTALNIIRRCTCMHQSSLMKLTAHTENLHRVSDWTWTHVNTGKFLYNTVSVTEVDCFLCSKLLK